MLGCLITATAMAGIAVASAPHGGKEIASYKIHLGARVFHFLGEVETIFRLWAVARSPFFSEAVKSPKRFAWHVREMPFGMSSAKIRARCIAA